MHEQFVMSFKAYLHLKSRKIFIVLDHVFIIFLLCSLRGILSFKVYMNYLQMNSRNISVSCF